MVSSVSDSLVMPTQNVLRVPGQDLLVISKMRVSDLRVSDQIKSLEQKMKGSCPFRWVASVLRFCGVKINGLTKDAALELEREIQICELFKSKRYEIASLYLAKKNKKTLSELMHSRAIATDTSLVEKTLMLFEKSIAEGALFPPLSLCN